MNPFALRHGIDLPIIQAPMAGSQGDDRQHGSVRLSRAPAASAASRSTRGGNSRLRWTFRYGEPSLAYSAFAWVISDKSASASFHAARRSW